jgi:TolB protein
MYRKIALLGASAAACAATVSGIAVAAPSARHSVAATLAKVVYHSRLRGGYYGGNNEVFVVSSKGGAGTRITRHPGADASPAWSPDGTRVAFESNRHGDLNAPADSDVYVMNADGSHVREVTFSNAFDGDPAWSRTNRIAFESERAHNVDVWTIGPNGSGEKQLTSSAAFDGDPAWSPDGRRIAFTSERDNGDREIYVMNADGSNQTRLTSSPGFDENPTWSPDGREIAFDSNRDGNLEIYVMNADGSAPTRVTNHPALDALPSFLPDGRIVFVSERIAKGQRRLFVANANGSHVQQLTRGSYDMSPDANRW